MDIVIYTNPETLFHKRVPGYHCWWSMSRVPKQLQEGDHIYFAFKGEVRGSFICTDIDPDDREETLKFNSDSWVQTDEYADWIFCKPFRGFRYKWWNK